MLGRPPGGPVQSTWSPRPLGHSATRVIRAASSRIEWGMGETDREFLLVREPGGADARIEVAPAALRIGGRPGNQVVLTDSYASGDHAEVIRERGKRCVRDLGSTNGTCLNGQPIAPRRS